MQISLAFGFVIRPTEIDSYNIGVDMMWTLVIALWIDTTPPEMKYTRLAEVKTYQECRELAGTLRRRGLEAHLFCVQQQ